MSLPGGSEWIIILFIVLLFFGARKLPDLAGSFGKSIKEFRKSSKDAFEDGRDDESNPAEQALERTDDRAADRDPER